MTRTLIVFGAGPGIGNNVAAEFASKRTDHVILLSRNTQRLQNEDAPFVSKRNASVKVDIVRTDLSDLASIPGVLKELDSMTQGEDIEVIFFNAARIKPSEVLGVSVEEIEEDFKVLLVSYALDPSCSIAYRTLITDLISDNQSISLHGRTALHSQAPGPGQIQKLCQTRSSCHKQSSALGPYSSTSQSQFGQGISEEYG